VCSAGPPMALTSPPSGSSSTSSHKIPVGAVVGGVIGGIAVLVVLIALLLRLRRGRQFKTRPEGLIHNGANGLKEPTHQAQHMAHAHEQPGPYLTPTFSPQDSLLHGPIPHTGSEASANTVTSNPYSPRQNGQERAPDTRGLYTAEMPNSPGTLDPMKSPSNPSVPTPTSPSSSFGPKSTMLASAEHNRTLSSPSPSGSNSQPPLLSSSPTTRSYDTDAVERRLIALRDEAERGLAEIRAQRSAEQNTAPAAGEGTHDIPPAYDFI
jgi:hypothetical protein